MNESDRKIHIRWPVLCCVHIQDALKRLNEVSRMLASRGEHDLLRLAAIEAIETVEALERRLNIAYADEPKTIGEEEMPE